MDSETGARTRRYLPAYRTIRYGEMTGQIEAIASFWRHSDRHRVRPVDMVAFVAFTGAKMAPVDLACAHAHVITVPLRANRPSKDMEDILSDTAPVPLVSSIDALAPSTGYALKQESIRSILVIDADPRVDAERCEIEAARGQLADAGGGIALTTFEDAVCEGGQCAASRACGSLTRRSCPVSRRATPTRRPS